LDLNKSSSNEEKQAAISALLTKSRTQSGTPVKFDEDKFKKAARFYLGTEDEKEANEYLQSDLMAYLTDSGIPKDKAREKLTPYLKKWKQLHGKGDGSEEKGTAGGEEKETKLPQNIAAVIGKLDESQSKIAIKMMGDISKAFSTAVKYNQSVFGAYMRKVNKALAQAGKTNSGNANIKSISKALDDLAQQDEDIEDLRNEFFTNMYAGYGFTNTFNKKYKALSRKIRKDLENSDVDVDSDETISEDRGTNDKSWISGDSDVTSGLDDSGGFSGEGADNVINVMEKENSKIMKTIASVNKNFVSSLDKSHDKMQKQFGNSFPIIKELIKNALSDSFNKSYGAIKNSVHGNDADIDMTVINKIAKQIKSIKFLQ
jgi:hypothetical protein